MRETRFVLPFDGMRLVSRQGWRAETLPDLRVVPLDYAQTHPGAVVRYRTHNGTDWTNSRGPTEGEPLRSSLPAIVRFADDRGGVSPFSGYGNAVVLEYAPYVLALYAHCQEIEPGLAVGDRIEAGVRVARVGRTSRPGHLVGAAHLHWELVRRWPLAADQTAERYDVTQTLATVGWALASDGTLIASDPATNLDHGRSGLVRGYPPTVPSHGTWGFADLAALAWIVSQERKP